MVGVFLLLCCWEELEEKEGILRKAAPVVRPTDIGEDKTEEEIVAHSFLLSSSQAV